MKNIFKKTVILYYFRLKTSDYGRGERMEQNEIHGGHGLIPPPGITIFGGEGATIVEMYSFSAHDRARPDHGQRLRRP